MSFFREDLSSTLFSWSSFWIVLVMVFWNIYCFFLETSLQIFVRWSRIRGLDLGLAKSTPLLRGSRRYEESTEETIVSRVSSAFLLIWELFEDAAVKILFNMLWMLLPIESAKRGTNYWKASRLFVCTFIFESLLRAANVSMNLIQFLPHFPRSLG